MNTNLPRIVHLMDEVVHVDFTLMPCRGHNVSFHSEYVSNLRGNNAKLRKLMCLCDRTIYCREGSIFCELNYTQTE